MSEKRRDNKNRILRSGESQRKDGRYAYKYVDSRGKSQFVYAWKLVSTDKTPAGKRDDISLREKEKQIQRDIDDGINISDSKMTVYELCSKSISQRNIRRNTERTYRRMLNSLEKDKLAHYAVRNVKMSDAKDWVLRMKEKGLSYATINHDKQILKSSFQMAVQDDYIRKNPFDFKLNTIIEKNKRETVPLTSEQEKRLLSFIQNDNFYCKYYDEFVILLQTGLRISELCGLTEADLDFTEKTINVDHQLLRDKNGYYIEKPKTSSGMRQIPMTSKAIRAFQNVLKNRVCAEPIIIEGYSGFLFLDKYGSPKVSSNYEHVFYGIVKKYNKYNSETALMRITPHTFRHTFCTKLANAGMNPKALQYIMGHSDINMTLNHYAHATFDSAKSEMMRLHGEM